MTTPETPAFPEPPEQDDPWPLRSGPSGSRGRRAVGRGRSRFEQPEGHLPMEGAQTLAVPGPPGASRPGAVQRAGVATDQRHVLGAGAPQGGGPLTGVPVVRRPDAAGGHRRVTTGVPFGSFIRP